MRVKGSPSFSSISPIWRYAVSLLSAVYADTSALLSSPSQSLPPKRPSTYASSMIVQASTRVFCAAKIPGFGEAGNLQQHHADSNQGWLHFALCKLPLLVSVTTKEDSPRQVRWLCVTLLPYTDCCRDGNQYTRASR